MLSAPGCLDDWRRKGRKPASEKKGMKESSLTRFFQVLLKETLVILWMKQQTSLSLKHSGDDDLSLYTGAFQGF